MNLSSFAVFLIKSNTVSQEISKWQQQMVSLQFQIAKLYGQILNCLPMFRLFRAQQMVRVGSIATCL